MKKLFSCLFLIICVSSFLCCKKTTQNQGIPYVSVNTTIYPSLPQYIKLNTVGGWVYVAGGSKGIIVYRKTNEAFMAYDRHCTYQPEKGQVVYVDSTSNITIKDPLCNSQFLLTDGSVYSSPATMGLKSYATSFDGNALTITN
jgi:nitrite reductase/ring-hydroxylating ferredoxin subunit